jgi:outer membrane protein TolC
MMSHSLSYVRCAALLCAALIVAVPHAGEYTLPELVSEALRTSPEIKKVESELAKTEAQVWEARGRALPSITASANYQYAWETFNPLGAGMDFGGGDPSASDLLQDSLLMVLGDPSSSWQERTLAGGLYGVTAGFDSLANISFETPRNTIALNLSLNQPIFAQGKVRIGLSIAREYRTSLLCKFDAARQATKAQITKLFYAALLAQTAAEIQRSSLEIARESHRIALAKQAVGKASEIDTFGTRLSIEETTMGLRKAEGDKRATFAVLIKQAGLEDTVEGFSVRGEFPADNYHISLAEALERMRENNKQIGQLDGGEQVQRELVNLQKTDYYPMVYCGASLGKFLLFDELGDIDWTAEGQNDGKVFVGASFTLFGGLQRHQKIQQAKEDLRSFQLTKQQAIDGLEVGVRNAWEAVETNRLQVESARALVALAAKGHELSKRAYEVGTMTLVELQDKELKLRSARMALNAALFALHSAVIDLRLLMGDLPLND